MGWGSGRGEGLDGQEGWRFGCMGDTRGLCLRGVGGFVFVGGGYWPGWRFGYAVDAWGLCC